MTFCQGRKYGEFDCWCFLRKRKTFPCSVTLNVFKKALSSIYWPDCCFSQHTSVYFAGGPLSATRSIVCGRFSQYCQFLNNRCPRSDSQTHSCTQKKAHVHRIHQQQKPLWTIQKPTKYRKKESSKRVIKGKYAACVHLCVVLFLWKRAVPAKPSVWLAAFLK